MCRCAFINSNPDTHVRHYFQMGRWQCHICHKEFATSSSGLRHKRTVHGPKTQCTRCTEKFPKRKLDALKSHTGRCHQSNIPSLLDLDLAPPVKIPRPGPTPHAEEGARFPHPITPQDSPGRDDPPTWEERPERIIAMRPTGKFERGRARSRTSSTSSSDGSPSRSERSSSSSSCSSNSSYSSSSSTHSEGVPSPMLDGCSTIPAEPESPCSPPASRTPDDDQVPGYDPESPAMEDVPYIPTRGIWGDGSEAGSYAALARDPRLFAVDAPSSHHPGEAGHHIRPLRRQARSGAMTVSVMPAGGVIHRVERACLPDGTIYQLSSSYVPPAEEVIKRTHHISIQCDLIESTYL